VVLTRRKRRSARNTPKSRRLSVRRVSAIVIRGAVPVHEALNGLAGRVWPFIHSTELRDKQVLPPRWHLKTQNRSVVGPAVLLPRVGEPSATKCCVYRSKTRLVLSDCVFGIQCKVEADARRIHSRLVNSWRAVQNSYGGTCAPYISLARLVGLLRSIGVSVERTEPPLRE